MDEEEIKEQLEQDALAEQEEIEQSQLQALKEKRKEKAKKEAKQKAKKAVMKKVIAALGPTGVFILIGGIVLLVLMLVLASFFQNADDVRKNGMSAIDGVKGTEFYGCTVVYKDDAQARIELIENYIGILTGAITQIETDSANAIDITINIPAEGFDYSTFNNLETTNEYYDAYMIINNMADVVYSYDNGTMPTELEFYPTLDGIKYFGINSELTENLSNVIANYIATDDNSYTTTGTTPTEAEIKTYVDTYLDGFETAIRTEKLIVKDYILAEGEQMPNLQAANYVGMIFMPKTDVEFSYFSFKCMDIDAQNFNMWVQAGNTQINLSSTYEQSIQTYIFESAKDLSVTASDYALQKAYEQPTSLFDLQTENANVVEVKTDDNGKEYNSFVFNGVSVRFESMQPFYFAEAETRVK